MKKSNYSISKNTRFIAIAAFMLLVSSALFAYKKQDFTKQIKKDFDISANGEVALYNKYGKIEVKTGSSNKVSIEVNIIVKANNENAAKESFERIRIDFSSEANYVKAQTNIADKSGWNWGSCTDDYTINYLVYMPKTCKLDLNNRYGDSYVAALDASARVDVKYGNFQMDGLSDNLMVTLGYGNGNVNNCKNLSAGISYGKLQVKEANNVAMTTKYSTVDIAKANDIAVTTKYDTYILGVGNKLANTGKYDHFDIKSINEIAVKSDYTDYKIGNIAQKGAFQISYGHLKIANLEKDFKNITVESKYTDVSIAVESGAGYSFFGEANYGNLKVPSEMNLTKNEARNQFSQKEGTLGSRSDKGSIHIKTSYGDCKIK